MYPVLLQWGWITIYSYGFMLALGVVLSVVLLLRSAKREGFAEDNILDISIIALIAGVIGSRLLYVFLYEWEFFRLHPWKILDLRSQGLVFYGGLILGGFCVLGYIVIKKLSFWKLADLFAPYLALGYAFGRIGCFLNGCCYGKPTSVLWGMVFPGVDFISRHPTQLYSSLLAFLLFWLLYRFYQRRKFEGQVFLIYLISYALIRFFVEFFRENLLIWQDLTVAQVTALGIAILAVVAYLIRRKKKDLPLLSGKEE